MSQTSVKAGSRSLSIGIIGGGVFLSFPILFEHINHWLYRNCSAFPTSSFLHNLYSILALPCVDVGAVVLLSLSEQNPTVRTVFHQPLPLPVPSFRFLSVALLRPPKINNFNHPRRRRLLKTAQHSTPDGQTTEQPWIL